MDYVSSALFMIICIILSDIRQAGMSALSYEAHTKSQKARYGMDKLNMITQLDVHSATSSLIDMHKGTKYQLCNLIEQH